MTKPFDPIPTTFGTVGLLQCQTRQLFNAWPISEDPKVNERAVGFCLGDRHTGVLPELLGTQVWMCLEEDSDEDPVLVLAAMEDGVALYVVANLNERATIAALAPAVHGRKIELVVASPGGLTSHWLLLSSVRRSTWRSCWRGTWTTAIPATRIGSLASREQCSGCLHCAGT